MPAVLALDAALSVGTVAVLDGGRVLAERTVPMKGTDAERLLPTVLDALAEVGLAPRQLSGVVCGGGPGSFTSLRIAASIAKGIASGSGATLSAVSSHALVIAGAEPGALPAGRYLVATDALRDECFVSLVTVAAGGLLTSIGAVQRMTTNALAAAAVAAEARMVGPGRGLDVSPHARGVARLWDLPGAIAAVDLDRWEPDYGRPAEAQVKWEAAHGRPLPAS